MAMRACAALVVSLALADASDTTSCLMPNYLTPSFNPCHSEYTLNVGIDITEIAFALTPPESSTTSAPTLTASFSGTLDDLVPLPQTATNKSWPTITSRGLKGWLRMPHANTNGTGTWGWWGYAASCYRTYSISITTYWSGGGQPQQQPTPNSIVLSKVSWESTCDNGPGGLPGGLPIGMRELAAAPEDEQPQQRRASSCNAMCSNGRCTYTIKVHRECPSSSSWGALFEQAVAGGGSDGGSSGGAAGVAIGILAAAAAAAAVAGVAISRRRRAVPGGHAGAVQLRAGARSGEAAGLSMGSSMETLRAPLVASDSPSLQL